MATNSSSEVSRLPPGPFALPIFGNAYLMACPSKYLSFTEMEKDYGQVFRIYLGTQLAVVISGDAIKEALVTKAVDFAGRPSLYSADVFSHDGKAPSVAIEDYSPRLKHLRDISFATLKFFTPDQQASIISEKLDRLIQNIHSKLGEPQDVTEQILQTVGSAFCTMSFGSRNEEDDPELKKLIEVDSEIFTMLTNGFAVDLFPWLKHFPSTSIRSLRELCKERDEILGKIYHEHVQSNRVENPEDMTDVILKAKKEAEDKGSSNEGIQLTQDRITMFMNDIFIASMNNITYIVSWALLYLIHYPEVQRTLHEELERVIGPNRLPELKDQECLHFLKATITETQRLSSHLPFVVPRKTTVDTTLQGYFIPKDTTVFANVWSLHHNPDIWEDPEDFKPQRFLDKDGTFVPPDEGHFAPFGLGPRYCTGASMAKMMVNLMLSRLLHSFKIENPLGQDPPSLKSGSIGVALAPKPFKISFVKVNDTD